MDLMWIAVYSDGSNVRQFDENGYEAKYSDIDRERLTEFHIVNREDETKTLFALALDPEQRLIYRRRIATSGNNEHRWSITMVGWQQTINGQNVQAISWVFPDGGVIQTGRFRDDHRLFYGVELLPFEEESDG